MRRTTASRYRTSLPEDGTCVETERAKLAGEGTNPSAKNLHAGLSLGLKGSFKRVYGGEDHSKRGCGEGCEHRLEQRGEVFQVRVGF